MTETGRGNAVQSGTPRVLAVQVVGATSRPENPPQLEQPLADDAGLDSTDLQFLAIAHRDEIAAAWQGTECVDQSFPTRQLLRRRYQVVAAALRRVDRLVAMELTSG